MKENNNSDNNPFDPEAPTSQGSSNDPNFNDHNLYHDDLTALDEKADVAANKSAVAQTAKQNLVALIILVVAITGVVYFFFFKDSDADKKKNTSQESPPTQSLQKPVSAADELSLPSIPNSPPPPPELDFSSKQLPSAPPTIVEKPSTPASVKAPAISTPPLPSKNAAQDQQKLAAKLSSNIMLNNGNVDGDKESKKKAPLYLENFIPEHTTSSQQKVTRVGNMSLLIAQGKVIESVLETPINTNYPGPVRAVVSSDVYSESGKNILIPRGSRLVGQFAGGYSPGQTRIVLTWDRIIMPNGFDIDVKSPAIGASGTAGIEGKVDNQLAVTISNAILYSALNIAFTEAASQITNSTHPSTTSVTTGIPGVTGPTTSSTTTATPTQQAIQQQATNLGNTVQQLAQQFSVAKPFITLDQGTLVNVFVNRDILFPKDLASNTRVVE